MKVVRQLTGLRQRKRPVCLAIGFFDGVHIGHQDVLRHTLERARVLNGEAWAMTFDPHPLKVLTPGSAPLMLTSTTHKLRLLRQFGLDGCLLLPFTHRFAAMPAATFLDRLQRDIPTLRCIFVGRDWRFGHQGEGDIRMLTAWANRLGIEIHLVSAIRRGSSPVSSTRVRDAIIAGRLSETAALLGRPYSMLGTVKQGRKIGRAIGFPTANLAPHNEAHPPTGIYAVQAIIARRSYPGVINFGNRPTVNPLRVPLLELHLLDTRANLYGRQIEVFFLKRLRDEARFTSLEALARQIARDVRNSRRVLSSARLQNSWIRTLQKWHPDIIVRPTTNK